MRRFKQTSKKNSNKVKYEIKNNNVLFEDSHTHGNHTSKFKLIADPKQPMYKYEYKEDK